jgi:hypothetical protein
MSYFERECVAALSFTTSARVTAREQTFLSAVLSIGATLDYGYPSIPVPCVVVRRSSIYEIRCLHSLHSSHVLATVGNSHTNCHSSFSAYLVPTLGPQLLMTT